MKNSTTILESFTKMIFGSSILFLCCCGNKRTPQNMEPSLAIDSVVFYYTYVSYLSFVAESSEEFATSVKNYRKQHGHIKITDRDTIQMLYQKIRVLEPEKDTIKWHLDARIMGIFHNPTRNDSLFLSQLYNNPLELNHKTMQNDTCLWVFVRDAICERDTAYSNRFSNSRGL